MSSSSDAVVIPQIEADTPGLYLFNQKELAVYLDLKAASKDELLTPKQQNQHRSNAVAKLRKVIEQRMPITEKLVLEANIQAAMDRKHEEKRQRDNYALSLFTSKQREEYYVLLAGTTDPKNTPAKQKRCAYRATQKLKDIITKQAEKEKRAAMTPEELAMYDKNPERVAAKAEKTRYQKARSAKHHEKEAALCNAGDVDALAQRAAKNEASRISMATTRQRKKEEEAAITKIFPESARNSTVFGEGDDR
jgi:hypothetical protein